MATAEDLTNERPVPAGNRSGNYFRLAGTLCGDPAFNPIGKSSNQFKGFLTRGERFYKQITINITKNHFRTMAYSAQSAQTRASEISGGGARSQAPTIQKQRGVKFTALSENLHNLSQ
jgi:hypothetical protein